MCGIEEGSAVEHEELSALGLKLDRIQGSVDELKGLVTAKNERLRGRALARQDKERALEQFEVEPDSVEAEPFAKGAEGSVHKASYSEEDVALKKSQPCGYDRGRASEGAGELRDGIGDHGEASESARGPGAFPSQ